MSKSTASLLIHEFHYDALTFLRNGRGVFFTLGLPVLFLLIFASVFGDNVVRVRGGLLRASVYYVSSLIAFGVISAAFGNLILTVTATREAGIYKRRRATPVPAGVIIGGRALVAVFAAAAIAALLVGVGWPLFGASIPVERVPSLVLDIIVGGLAFCCLGFAVASVIPNEDAVQPVTQAIVLPLYFISGVFVSASAIPDWLTRIANFFPVRHLAQALLTAYNPYASGSAFAWHDLAILALWGVIGLAVALRRFSWLPQGR